VYGEGIDRLNELFDIRHEKLLIIPADKPATVRHCGSGGLFEMRGYYNKFTVSDDKDVSVLARVESPDVHKGSPAAIEKKLGNGKLVFLAGLPSKQWLKLELKRLAADAGLEAFDLPEKTELVRLCGKDDNPDVYVAINKQDKPLKLSIGGKTTEIPPMDFGVIR
jgi:hypothetical protein